MSTRQWSIKGNQISDPRAMQIVRAECDGPVPEVNETVHVIEKSAYDAIKAENERLRAALKACWEAEHYEYCGQQFSETGDTVEPCKSVAEHIARELAALDGGEK